MLTPGEKRKLEDMCRWGNNIKMFVKDYDEMMCTGSVCMKISTGCGLSTRQ